MFIMEESSISAEEMKALELNVEYFGISRLQMMENAGRCIAQEIAARFSGKNIRVAIFCGLGGNGGDGFVAARHLLTQGFKVILVIAGNPSRISDDAARQNWEALKNLKDCLTVYEVTDSSALPDVRAEVIVDALVGIGLKGKVRSPILPLIRKINEMQGFCLAVDIPSGVDADTGEVHGEAVRANLTITFHRMKLGLEKAIEYTGEIIVRDIGVPAQLEKLAGPGDVFLVRVDRPLEAHKGDFGRLFIIGGSQEFTGAPALAALAALRVGVDLVYVAAPKEAAYTIASMSPNLITIKLEGSHLNPNNVPIIRRYLEKVNAVIMGPGLGLHPETKEAVKILLETLTALKLPLLLDADGLKAYAEINQPFEIPTVLTPHAGEYRILTRKTLSENLDEKTLEIRETAARLNAVILLKGHVDIISDGQRLKLNYTGNPGMTVGGTGDILSGIVGAFLAHQADPFEAAVAGAFVNGVAGDFAVEKLGYHIVPTDILEWIPKALDDPMSHLQVRRKLARRR